MLLKPNKAETVVSHCKHPGDKILRSRRFCGGKTVKHDFSFEQKSTNLKTDRHWREWSTVGRGRKMEKRPSPPLLNDVAVLALKLKLSFSVLFD